MPITEFLDVNDAQNGDENLFAEVIAGVYANLNSIREVRARGARGVRGGRPKLLGPTLGVRVGPDDDLSQLARDVARRVIDQILVDANEEGWRGSIEMLGEPDDKGKPNVIASVPVIVPSGTPIPKPTRDDEIVGILGSLRDTIKGLGEVVVRVGSTKADELAAYGNMIGALADMMRKMGASQGKWEYRIHRESQETERHTETERARAAKSRAFWDAFETFATEWKDVGMVWSKWVTEKDPKSGAQKSSDAPTEDECKRVFGALDFCERQITIDEGGNRTTSTIRSTVAELISEPDAKARMILARRLGALVGQLSIDEKNRMTKHTVEVLGVERAQQVVRWLSAPFAFGGSPP